MTEKKTAEPNPFDDFIAGVAGKPFKCERCGTERYAHFKHDYQLCEIIKLLRLLTDANP